MKGIFIISIAVVTFWCAEVCPLANAAYVATLNQVGTDVVGTGSGSLDITDLTFIDTLNAQSQMRPSSGVFLLGPATQGIPFNLYESISGPASFGSGGIDFSALSNAGSGNFVGVSGAFNNLFVMTGYASGTPLGTSTATWSNASFASLGVTPGTYVWTWGSDDHADTFTLQIGTAVPEPNMLLLFFYWWGFIWLSQAVHGPGTPIFLSGSPKSQT